MFPPNVLRSLDDPKLLAFFSINMDARHPKLVTMPLGIDNVNQSFFLRAVASSSLIPKKYTLYIEYFNLRNGNARMDRNAAMTAGRRIASRLEQRGRVSLEEWTFAALQSRFALAPLGNGIDCTRTWRLLLLGTIPIVCSTTNPLVGLGLFDDLPVVVVKRWDDVSDSLLENEYLNIVSRFGTDWRREVNFGEYWVALLYRYKAYGQALLDEGRMQCARHPLHHNSSWNCRFTDPHTGVVQPQS